ncbi:6-bladed beta-propeller [Chitinophaga silvatica]|uniref:6-bladed beta-propeller n=1 Tax=Chitinophaga silvatica TaxID=2282649 RepID=UPI001314BE46|nr:6-bladed beta-propeller [Chitinophaga silvatica]
MVTILFGILTINKQTNGQTPADAKKIMIDPMNAMGGTASKYFEDVQYIPLQTTKESLFGKIDQLLVTPSYFIILDKTTEAVLFFNKDGSYHHKISKFQFDKIFQVPNSTGPKRSIISSISINETGDKFYISSIFEPAVLYIYTFDGIRTGKINLPANTQDYYQLKNGYFICKQQRPYSANKLNNFKQFDISIYKDSITIPLSLFPVIPNQTALLDDLYGHIKYLNKGATDTTCLYSPDFSYHLYELGTTGISREFEVLLPKYLSIPQNFDTDSAYVGKRKEFLKDKSAITSFWEASITNNCLLLDIRIPNTQNNINRICLLYSLKTSRLIALDKIGADDKTSYLPVSGNTRSDLLLSAAGDLYYSFPSLTMFSSKEAMKDKKPAYSPTLENYFKTENRKSNPVLVRLKLKSTI